MNKARQKYIIRMLDSYCLPMKRYLSLFVLIISLATIAQVVAITKLVSVLINQPHEFLHSWIYLVIVFVTMLVKAAAIYWRSSLTQKQAAKVRQQVREQVVLRCQQLGAKGLGHNTVDMSIFYLEQVELLNNYIARFYPQAITSRIQPLLILIAVFSLNWIAGLVLLLTSPLLPIFMILIGLKTSEMNAKQLKNLLYLGNQFHDKLVGIKTIIAFSQQKATLEKMTSNSQNYTHTTMQLLKIAFLNSAVLEFLSSVCVALMAVYFGIAYLEQWTSGSYNGVAITLFAGFFCLTLAGEFFQPLRDLGTFYHDRSSALNAMDELDKFINQQAQENQEYVDIDQVKMQQEQVAEKDDLYDSSFKTIDLATNTRSSKIYQSSAQATNEAITASKDELNTEAKVESQDQTKTGRKKGKRRFSPVFLDASSATSKLALNYPFSKADEKYLALDANTIIQATNLTIYTHAGKPLLTNLNFSFSLGEKVAIIGLSGAGKTSLLSCLLGLYPYTGSLTFNGVELTDINPQTFYPYFSWLGQNPNLDQTTILNNLSFKSNLFVNDLDNAPTIQHEQSTTLLTNYAQYLAKLHSLSKLSIKKSIVLAQLESLIAERGLQYQVQQHNIGLSGGQVQRIALARALAKPHLYLIIDEPTANLDAKLEKAIFDNIKHHQQGILMVTHRLEQSAAFDKIYTLTKQGISLTGGNNV
ncbi:ATP-binding cassette domain-containing protein [Psittacicella hinzii]|uniref:Uncharacterized protein n=1 Tax=Psittacicella hinzii TaxID=2028575 RepID=A0A3A1YUQ2_9GAMM|nr:ATP-binding cassette domain-containing protein [Psittacicella hinzii]RIY40174.1 hypothetical protein CKF58_00905 [Psittacicella hinzii]